MSRSGYSDEYDLDQWQMIRWRGAVKQAISGRRGQAFLGEMLAALDALDSKRLIRHVLVKEGEVCAIGSVALSRALDVSDIDPDDWGTVAGAFGIAEALVREVEYENDDCGPRAETPEARYQRMHRWVEAQLSSAQRTA